MGICAAFGGEHDLFLPRLGQQRCKHKVSYLEAGMTYPGIIHEYVEPLLSCEKSFDARLNGRQIRQVDAQGLETAQATREPRSDAGYGGGRFGLGSTDDVNGGVVRVEDLGEFKPYTGVSTRHDENLE